MIRLFIFLLVVLALGFGFSWIADKPGEVSVAWQGTEYQASLMVVLTALVAMVIALMVVIAIIRTVFQSPAIMSRFFRRRRRERGFQALSKGLIAAGSGDSETARRHAKESRKLVSDEPLVKLLEAQTALMEGKRDEARETFTTMLENKDTKLVALRGLYLEAEREGASDAAHQYAREASTMAPALPWAGNANLRFQSQAGEWEEALKTLDSNRSAGLVDKETAKRQQAVLLTAQALANEQADPQRAAKLAQQAHKLAPDLIPAAVVGARAYARFDNTRAASKLIESVWKKSPHPELAEAYVYIRSGDSVLDRLKRAQHLSSIRSNHPEGNIAVAEAAIVAMDWKTARDAMKPVLMTQPTERACLIMADIEEGEHGDRGRMREWLSRAVRAPRDPVWTADGYVSETWMPISPVTGEIDAFEWKLPVEQLKTLDGSSANPQDMADLEMLIDAPVEPMKPVPPADQQASSAKLPGTTTENAAKDNISTVAGAAVAANTVASGSMATKNASPADEDNPEHLAVEDAEVIEIAPPSENAQPTETINSKAETSQATPEQENTDTLAGNMTSVDTANSNASADQTGRDSANRKTATPSASIASEKPAAEVQDADNSHVAAAKTTEPDQSVTSKEPQEKETEPASIFPLTRRPDDPGVDPNEPPTKETGRFRLF